MFFLTDLLPFYAILRSIPNKLLGVIAMFSAILILLAMPFADLSKSRGLQFRPLSKIAFFIFVGNFLILMQLGAKHVESPFIELGQISTVIFFAHFLTIVPLVSLFENSLIEISNKDESMIFKDLAKTEINSSNKLHLQSDLAILPLFFLCLLSTNFKILNIFLNKILLIEYCDAPRPWGIYFQDSATPQMEGLVELHDNILFYLVIILFGVGWMLLSIIKNYTYTESPISHKYLNHGTLIELIWTITPALILMLIAFPSFKLLYLMDEVSDPAMSVLAEGFLFVFYSINPELNGGLKSHILN